MKKGAGKAQIRSNSVLLREFATLQGVFSHGRVRPHELISASLVGKAWCNLLSYLAAQAHQSKLWATTLSCHRL